MHRQKVLLVSSRDFGWNDLRQALAARRDARLVGEATSVAQARNLARATQPDVILCAATVERASALPLLAEMRQSLCPDSKVVVFAARFDPGHAAAVYELGIGGYAVWGELSSEELPEELPAILGEGHGFYTTTPLLALRELGLHGVRSREQPGTPGRDDESLLDERDRAMLRLAAQGKKSAAIGAALHMEEQSVRNRFSRLFAKLGVANRAAAVAWAKERGLI